MLIFNTSSVRVLTQEDVQAKNIGGLYALFVLISIFILSFYSGYSDAAPDPLINAEKQRPSFSFLHLKPDEISSIGSVNVTIRDHKGYMWFGGEDGLAKFDGHELSIFKNHFDEPASLSNNFVYDILEDSRGQLWVATRNGLNQYDRDRNQFVRYLEGANHSAITTIFEQQSGRLWFGTRGAGLVYFDRGSESFRLFESSAEKRLGLSNNIVSSIAEDSLGNLWVGTERGGLNYLDLASGQVRHFKNKPGDSKTISANDVRSIIVDEKDNLWVGTFGGGLSYYDKNTRRFSRYDKGANGSKLSDPYIRDMFIDRDAYLWIATENGGLNKFDPKSEIFVHYLPEADNPTSIASNSPVSIYEDVVGDLWIGLSPSGVDTLNKNLPRFTRYRHKKTDSNSLSVNDVTAVVESTNNNLWVGTRNGLNYIDRNNNKITRYKHDPKTPESLPSATISSLLVDRRGHVWVGTDGQGVSRLDPASGKFTHLPLNSNKRKSVSGSGIRVIYEDSEGDIWFGAERSGLTQYNNRTGQFTHYRHVSDNPNSIAANMVNAIYEDSNGKFWVGTSNGLDLFDKDMGVFRHFKNDEGDRDSLSADHVTTLLEDKRGQLWVGTHGGGVNLMNFRKGTFKSFGSEQGLPSNIVTGLQEDEWGYLWHSTPEGLSRFDTKSERYKNYDERHGLLGSLMSNNASIKGRNGELIFGSTEGLSVFDPVMVQDNLMIPPVMITDFRLLGKPVEVGQENSPLLKSIDQTDRLLLNPTQTELSFSFAVLNYRTPEENKYSYMLEGVDKNWSKIGKVRTARYEDVKPGKYTFRVRGYNDEGVISSKGAKVEIIVASAAWANWRSYVPYLIAIVMFISAIAIVGFVLRSAVGYYKKSRRKVSIAISNRKRKTKIAKLKNTSSVKKLKSAKNNDRQRAKLPSAKVPSMQGMINDKSLALGGMSGANNGETESKKEKLEVTEVNLRISAEKSDSVRKNANVGKSAPDSKPQVIVSSSKSAASPTEREVKNKASASNKNSSVNVYKIVSAVLRHSRSRMGKKKLEFINNVSKTMRPEYLNERRLQKALYNLVSNSIRISNKGKISISAEQKGSYLLFKVTNSGIGFTENKFSEIFNASTHSPQRDGSSFVFTLPFPINDPKDVSVSQSQSVAVDKPSVDKSAKNVEAKSRSAKPKRANRNKTVELRPEEVNKSAASTLHKKAISKVVADNVKSKVKQIASSPSLNEAKKTVASAPKKVVSEVIKKGAEFTSQKVTTLTSAQLDTVKDATVVTLKNVVKGVFGNENAKTRSGNQTNIPSAERKPAVFVNKSKEQPSAEGKPVGLGKKPISKKEISEAKNPAVFESRDVTKVDVDSDIEFDSLSNFDSVTRSHDKKPIFVDTKTFVESVLQRDDDEIDAKREPADTEDNQMSDFVVEASNEDFVFAGSDSSEKMSAESFVKLVKSESSDDKIPSYHILIVDEDPVKRMIVQNYLSAENYRVSQVDCGADAMSLINKSDSIDLVLLGVMLPGISGYQVCEQLREAHSSQDLPIIFMSEMTMAEDLELCYVVGGNDVLTRNISKADFLNKVKVQIITLEYHRSQKMAKDFRDSQLPTVNKVS